MLRGLIHHRGIHLAVVFGVAASGAVLTGALLVGDSVRGSLRDLTLDRLGAIDTALIAERFFRADLADAIATDPAFERAVGAILLRGNAVHAQTRARASRLNVLGVDDRFVELFAEPAASAAFRRGAGEGARELDFARRDGQIYPSLILNTAAAAELGAEVGDSVLVHFRLGSDVPRDTLLGDRAVEETVGTIRTEVVSVIPDRGVGRFDLGSHQTFPLNAYLTLPRLQAALEQPGRVNALLVDRADPGGSLAPDPLARLRELVSAADLGLEVASVGDGSVLQIESEEFVLRPDVVATARDLATERGAATLSLQAYLANAMEVEGRITPYSMVLAIDNPGQPAPFGQLTLVDGRPAPPLADDEILLNEWAAEDLGAQAGVALRMTYYVVGIDEQLRTEQADFRVAGVVAMEGLAVDPDLAPEYPGIDGADDMAGWDPPFPVALALIRDKDEAYWDEYRTAPKAFVSEATGRRLWSTRYGAVTSMRIAVSRGPGRAELGSLLAREVNLPALGFRTLEARAQGLAAAAGPTDFGQLFLAFSMFIIGAALMIVGLLFGLGVERRASEVGLLLAVGYPVARVRRRFLAEGLVLAVGGAVGGAGAAVAYARAMLWGLTTLWLPAVGSPLLFLHVESASLAIGVVATVIVALIAVRLALRRLRVLSTRQLLAGDTRRADRPGAPRRARLLALGAAPAALGLAAAAIAGGQTANPGLTFAIGALLLAAGLGTFAAWCRSPRGRLGGAGALLQMAARSSAWNPGRSLLAVALVAFACFVLVTVAGNTRDPAREAHVIEQGAGGFELIAASDVPLHHDLNGEEARFELGFSDRDRQALEGVTIAQFRLVPGDDASCLNLYQPQRPRLIGMPDTQIERGGFVFSASLAREHALDDPWELLRLDLGDDVVPVIADANSATWILKMGLGDELVLPDGRGESVRLRLVATVRESIFQSELLMSERHLLRHFPDRSGFSYFLIDTPAERSSDVAAVLEETLARYGFDTVGAADRIAGFLVVQNTYLSTFQALGGLGLLLGTVGLGIVLLRNVVERRGELATLRAFGFRRPFLSRMVLAENAFLLGVGALIGSLSALLAMAPRLVVGPLELPWGSLLTTLIAVAVVGMGASIAAVAGALRVPLLPALKAER